MLMQLLQDFFSRIFAQETRQKVVQALILKPIGLWKCCGTVVALP
jgi:hypothetical protein